MRLLLAMLVLVIGELAHLGTAGAAVAVVAGAASAAVVTWARWYANSFTLTSSTMTFRAGLLVRSCRVIAVEAVQDVTTHQSLAGLLLGYGTLDIRLRSGPLLPLTTVPKPEILRDRILAAGMNAASAQKTIGGQISGWSA
jgi:uncharacterized membrane protein YdbT with pleckstrin-like domain